MITVKKTTRCLLTGLFLLACTSLVLTPAVTWADAAAEPAAPTAPATTPDEQGTPSGAGLQAASFALTIPYGIAKTVFALTGGIVGGLTYVFTGLDTDAAKKVWHTSMYGTYVITPEHLRGEKPVRFLGVSDESRVAHEPAGTLEASPAPESLREPIR